MLDLPIFIFTKGAIMGLFDIFDKKGGNRKGSGDKGGGKSHNDHRDKAHRQKETHTKSSPGRSSGRPGRGGNRWIVGMQ